MIDRRELVHRSALTAVGWQLGVWLVACRATASAASPADPVEDPPIWSDEAEIARLRAAKQRAHALRRPLLALVLPESSRTRAQHGRIWGLLLQDGAPLTIAGLATCELTCARPKAVEQVLPGVGLTGVEPAALPLALVLDPGERCPRWLASIPKGSRSYRPSSTDVVALLEQSVAASLAPDRDALILRIREEARRRLLAPPDVCDADAVSAVANAMRSELAATPPEGAAWADRTGCGTAVEHPSYQRGTLIQCGMGRVAERERRFLFYDVSFRR